MPDQIPVYSREKTLLIPECLHDMVDAHCVMGHGEASIFYKNIPQNMTDVEFFTNAPCLAFVLSGEETFASYERDEIVLRKGQMLFMPKNSYMISDFVRTDGPLEAFLFFFDDGTIKEFLKSRPLAGGGAVEPVAPYEMNADPVVEAYMAALYAVYRDFRTSPEIVRVKLLELLNILELTDNGGNLCGFLSAVGSDNPKRNIKRLLADPIHWKLSIADLARLSGRPATSFNRDFRRQFGTTPQKWLIAARLERAHDLLRASSLSVSEIALEVGYENISHFITVFKKKFGVSPKKLRLENNW
ncbi:helix-turn-helix domain-containing protein [Aestuariispira insulae]|uniref:AraC family transcriptional regulator n=1 Tax=Aestuariispira insulae TaxID=1461337 RepID=A0A3D9HGG7_9PROT|nr:AraC family transcriptional regulator [Aestuariispira insulae]RED48515.1 AraC family transcriptional regulator [Aestuariispira insulae]